MNTTIIHILMSTSRDDRIQKRNQSKTQASIQNDKDIRILMSAQLK